MTDDDTRHMQAMWVPSTLHPERRVAQPTLAALLQLLRRKGGAEPAAAQTLDAAPALGTVGGIARIEGPDGQAVGVARIGRTSFVGYRLMDDSLDEVEVALDESTGRLSIRPAPRDDSLHDPPAA